MAKTRKMQSAPSRRARARQAKRVVAWRAVLGLCLVAAVFLWGSYVGMRAFERAVANRRRQIRARGAAAQAPTRPDTVHPSQPTAP